MSTTYGRTDQSLRVTETGFTVFHLGVQREFQDSDVSGVEIHRQHTPGLQTTAETLRVRVGDRQDVPVFLFESVYSGPDDDFAAPFRERLLLELLHRTMESLHRGDEFDAGSWSISLDGVQDTQTGTRIPIEMISVAQWRDGHFCVGGEGYETIRLATHAENTHLLPLVLQYLLPEGTAPAMLSHSATGRTLAEFRDTPPGVVTAVGISAGVGIALAVGFLRFAPVNTATAYAILGAVAVVVVAVLTAVHFLYGKAVLLRHLDNALVRVHGAQEQVIPLDRLAGFAASWTDVYVNSAYSGTTVRFDFEPDSTELPKMVHHSDAKHGQPKYDDLQMFQGRISAVVAQRMKNELDRHGRVAWTTHVTILPHGIEFRKKASAEPTFYDFSQISRCQVDEGLLKVGIDGGKRPAFTEKCDQMNFFPGLALLQRLAAGDGAGALPGPEESAWPV